jgi:ubiquinone/menaquinone biosynthesis C-methylase UbiE
MSEQINSPQHSSSHAVPESRYRKSGLIDKLSEIIRSNDLILDLGCGRGIDASLLESKIGCTVVGIDNSKSALNFAMKKGLNLIRSDLNYALPLRSDAFNAALAIFLVHNIKKRESLFLESGRVLRENGKMLVLSASHDDIRRRWLNRFFPSLQEIDLHRYPSDREIFRLFGAAGMEHEAPIPVTLGTETLDAAYIEHVSERQWSSLQMISDREFTVGRDKFLAFASSPENKCKQTKWHNNKTLFIAYKSSRSVDATTNPP